MNDTPKRHQRKNLRLQHYDYSRAGYYYVTICTQNKKPYFGTIKEEVFYPNEAAMIIEKIFKNLPKMYMDIETDEYIVMPNHVHCILQKKDKQEIPYDGLFLGDIVGGFKSKTTTEYIKGVKEKNWPKFDRRLWQRNYYEHIIQDEKEYYQIKEYIRRNPENWLKDKYYY